jgi:hypothetical protein
LIIDIVGGQNINGHSSFGATACSTARPYYYHFFDRVGTGSCRLRHGGGNRKGRKQQGTGKCDSH